MMCRRLCVIPASMAKGESMKPRWYQSEAVDAALSSLKQSPLIVLPTGAGKSVVIAELCKAIQKCG